MKKRAMVAGILAWIAVCCLAGPSEAVKFRYENLGTLGGTQPYSGFSGKEVGINDAGQVVGKSYTSGGSLHAFVKSPGQAMLDLGNIPGSTESLARCINSSGVIGGTYQSPGYHACFWVPSGGSYLFQGFGGENSELHGINDAGYVVGAADVGSAINAVVKPPGAAPPFQDLGALPGHLGSRATGINSSRTIVGFSYDASYNETACFWSPSGWGYTATAPLFGVADSEAYAINTSGQAVGYATIAGVDHAVLKSPGEALQDLGLYLPGTSIAYDINDSGWVVGWAYNYGDPFAFCWTPAGGMQDLRDLVPNLPPGVRLERAMAINKRGEIAGYTANSVFKLTPITNPPLSLLLLD